MNDLIEKGKTLTKFGFVFIVLSISFFIFMEILEVLYCNGNIFVSMGKIIVMLFSFVFIIFAFKYEKTKLLFLSIIIFLIFTCFLFIFHLLFELNKKNTFENEIFFFNLEVVANILFAFFAFFACIFLFLLCKNIEKKQKLKNTEKLVFTDVIENIMKEKDYHTALNKRLKKNSQKKSKFYSCINVLTNNKNSQNNIMIENQNSDFDIYAQIKIVASLNEPSCKIILI